jgi:hypothetical protein
VEYIRAGAIGEVREAHIWTNRPLGFWPQGVPRPEPLKQPADTLKWNGPGINARSEWPWLPICVAIFNSFARRANLRDSSTDQVSGFCT